MRMSLWRLICVALLYGIVNWGAGCSSAQQEDDDLESSEQGQQEDEQGEEDEQEGQQEEGDEQESDDQEGDDFADEEEGDEDEEFADDEEGDEEDEELADEEGDLEEDELLDGEETSNDLQEIVANNQGANAGDNLGVNADVEAAQVANGGDAEAAPVEEAVPAETAPVEGAVAAAPAGGVLPEMGSKMPYIVRYGETLAKIAASIYGDSSKYTEMAELSSISNPNRVYPGDVVYYQLNETTLAFAKAYEGTPRVEVTVQTGDSLSRIAQRVYGNQIDWKYIWRQNAFLDNPDNLEVGQTIVYLNPGSLTAALKQAKAIAVAELIKSSYGKEDPNSEKAEGKSNKHVDGFKVAKNMFNVFAAQVGFAG